MQGVGRPDLLIQGGQSPHMLSLRPSDMRLISYGLGAVGAVTHDPERIPGARRIRELRKKIQACGARCVFSEPQFEPRLVKTLVFD